MWPLLLFSHVSAYKEFYAAGPLHTLHGAPSSVATKLEAPVLCRMPLFAAVALLELGGLNLFQHDNALAHKARHDLPNRCGGRGSVLHRAQYSCHSF